MKTALESGLTPLPLEPPTTFSLCFRVPKTLRTSFLLGDALQLQLLDDALLLQLLSDAKPFLLDGTILPGPDGMIRLLLGELLVLNDATLVINDATLVLDDATLVLGDATLVLGDAKLVLGDATLVLGLGNMELIVMARKTRHLNMDATEEAMGTNGARKQGVQMELESKRYKWI
jgi:hypothetical protein